MSTREEAIFINGIYETVLSEILQVQDTLPDHIMFLQPYASERKITLLADNPPSVDDRVRLFLSVTNDLARIRYVTEIVGWDNKPELQNARADAINRLIRTLQPGEKELYHKSEGDTAVSLNLLHVWRLRKLSRPFSVESLTLTGTGKPHSPCRKTAGGWSYVKNPGDEWLRQYL